jgi:hypothetical protein
MSKIITIKLKKAGNRASIFSLSDNYGNILATNISKNTLIKGFSTTVEDDVSVIIITYSGSDCCGKTVNIPITSLKRQAIVDLGFSELNKGSLWKHLVDPTLYNNFYGCIHPYIIEYPFAYKYHDEIVQSIKDYTKVYKYSTTSTHLFDSNNRVQLDDVYFNKAVLYNGQQSSGTLELVAKPLNNMKLYLSYPKFNTDSKTITFTKSDNFYQFNTYWSIVKDKSEPLFLSSCESLSIDKIVNDSNMNYSTRTMTKAPLRAKDLKVRLTLDDRSDVHLVSQVVFQESMISYK